MASEPVGDLEFENATNLICVSAGEKRVYVIYKCSFFKVLPIFSRSYQS